MPSLSSQIYLLVVIKLLFLSVIYVNKFEMIIISTARIKVGYVMFSFLCRFAPYCLNFSDHALTNTANHNGTRDRVIWKAQQVINLWDFYSLSALG